MTGILVLLLSALVFIRISYERSFQKTLLILTKTIAKVFLSICESANLEEALRWLNLIVKKMQDLFHIDFFKIYYTDLEKNKIYSLTDFNPQPMSLEEPWAATLLSYCAQNKTPLVIQKKEDFPMIRQETKMNSILIFPVAAVSRLIIFLVGSKKSNDFKDQKQESVQSLLELLAPGVLGVLQKQSDLCVSKPRDANEIQNELTLARHIQNKLVPTELPKVEGIELAAKVLPAKEVGGDFYDCFMLREGTLAMSLGDVSGKSIPAALLVSMAKFIFRFPPSMYIRPAKLMELANRLFFSNGAGLFITACFATFELAEKRLVYVNAGHPPLLCYRAKTDEVVYLGSTGIMLGVSENSQYREEMIYLASGDLLLFYSDGLTEVKLENGKVLGEEGLADYFKSMHGLKPSLLVEKLIEEILAAYRGENADDLACLLLKVL